MTDSERIAMLEQELAQVQLRMAIIAEALQQYTGAAAVFHCAVSALVESHHDYDALFPPLSYKFAHVDAEAISLANNEVYPAAVQAAQQELDIALQKLDQRQRRI